MVRIICRIWFWEMAPLPKGRMARAMSRMGLSSAAIRLELILPQTVHRCRMAHSPFFSPTRRWAPGCLRMGRACRTGSWDSDPRSRRPLFQGAPIRRRDICNILFGSLVLVSFSDGSPREICPHGSCRMGRRMGLFCPNRRRGHKKTDNPSR